MSDDVPGYAELEFDLPAALLQSLIGTLDRVKSVPLRAETAVALPEEQGVYQLFHDGVPVYVGKTDAKSGLMSRLLRHSRKTLHRRGLNPNLVSFKAIRVYVFTAVDIEGDLIRHYGGADGLVWNGSGFGSNDPGRERDTTRNKRKNFDYQYPIDIDQPIDFGLPARCTTAEALSSIKSKVPYTIRIQRAGGGRKLHADFEDADLICQTGLLTARTAIADVVRQLAPGWQATKLLGYVILYKEERTYPDAEVIARS